MSKKLNLGNLTREEKLRLIDALEEKKQRLKRQKPQYKPNSGQMEIHLDQHPIRVVSSGNGSGKSVAAVHELWWAANGYNPITKQYSKVPARIALVLDNSRKVEQVWLKYLKHWFDMSGVKEERLGKPYVSQLLFPNGSIVHIFTHDLAPEVYEGIEVSMIIADEPLPRHLWIGLSRGMREKGTNFRALLIGTPLGQVWMHKDLVVPAIRGDRSDVGVHRVSSYVNKENLAEGYFEAFTANLTEQEKKARLEGHPTQLEGLALAHLIDEKVHYIEPFDWDRNQPVVVAIDMHPSKKNIACLVGVDKGGFLYYIKEIASANPAAGFATELKEFMRGYRVLDIIADSLGSGASTGGEGRLSFIEVMNREGVRARPTTFRDKSDEIFMDMIRNVLVLPENDNYFGQKLPLLRIFNTCQGVIKDIEYVTWLRIKGTEDHKPKLDISDKDYLATLKYALATDIAKFKHGKPKTIRRKKSPWSGGGKKWKSVL